MCGNSVKRAGIDVWQLCEKSACAFAETASYSASMFKPPH